MGDIIFKVIAQRDPEGRIGIMGSRGDVSSAVWVSCPCGDKTHDKSCAQDLLDYVPTIVAASKADDGTEIPAVMGKTAREQLLAYFDNYDKIAASKPTDVEVPTKKVQKKIDGKLVTVDAPDDQIG